MSALADAPNLSGTFVGWQVLAAAIVLLLFWLAEQAVKSTAVGHGGLVTGADNRYSTGRIIAVSWTAVVAWMVLTEAFLSVHQSSLAAQFESASNLYFVLLGGPYAAAAFALFATQTKVSQSTRTKTPAPNGPSPADVISDDKGNIDTYDFQYTLFNLLAVVIVAFTFAAHPGHGLPDIPQFLAILTGGSALTYTVHKAAAASGPQITSVLPRTARIGDTITITGVQRYSGPAGSARPTITFGGIAATGVAIPTGTTDTLTATVVAASSDGLPLNGPIDVVVTPPVGSPIVLNAGLTIVADEPKITEIKPKTFTTGTALTVTGELLLAPGTAGATAAAGATDLSGLSAHLLYPQAGAAFDVHFEGKYSRDALTIRVDAPPAGIPGAPGDTAKAQLTLQRGTVATDPFDLEYKISGPPPVAPANPGPAAPQDPAGPPAA